VATSALAAVSAIPSICINLLLRGSLRAIYLIITS
jgi:hypothetical protein